MNGGRGLKENLDACIQEYPFIVWCISDEFNKLELDMDLKEYLSSGQVIPVRISRILSERNLAASFLGKKPISSGLLGFYLSIALINQDMEVFNSLLEKDELKQSPMNSSRFHVAENNGNMIQVNKVKGENITLGGNFVQKIYKKGRK